MGHALANSLCPGDPGGERQGAGGPLEGGQRKKAFFHGQIFPDVSVLTQGIFNIVRYAGLVCSVISRQSAKWVKPYVYYNNLHCTHATKL